MAPRVALDAVSIFSPSRHGDTQRRKKGERSKKASSKKALPTDFGFARFLEGLCVQQQVNDESKSHKTRDSNDVPRRTKARKTDGKRSRRSSKVERHTDTDQTEEESSEEPSGIMNRLVCQGGEFQCGDVNDVEYTPPKPATRKRITGTRHRGTVSRSHRALIDEY